MQLRYTTFSNHFLPPRWFPTSAIARSIGGNSVPSRLRSWVDWLAIVVDKNEKNKYIFLENSAQGTLVKLDSERRGVTKPLAADVPNDDRSAKTNPAIPFAPERRVCVHLLMTCWSKSGSPSQSPIRKFDLGSATLNCPQIGPKYTDRTKLSQIFDPIAVDTSIWSKWLTDQIGLSNRLSDQKVWSMTK